MCTVIVAATAQEDLQSIWECAAQYNTEAASKLIKEIYRQVHIPPRLPAHGTRAEQPARQSA